MSEPQVTAPETAGEEEPAPQVNTKSLETISMVAYGLLALSFLFGFTYIVAGIVSHIKISDARNTWLESHFRWQIRTFWFGILWSIIGIATAFVGIGYFILIANAIWLIYRIAKGWLRQADRKPMYS